MVCHNTLWTIILLTFLEIQPHIQSHGQALKNEKLKIRKKISCGEQPSEEKSVKRIMFYRFKNL